MEPARLTLICGIQLSWFVREMVKSFFISQKFFQGIRLGYYWIRDVYFGYSATHNACYGDASSPLVLGTSVANYMVVGLVSHSTSCYSPTAFIRLSAYSNWMQGIGGQTTETTTPTAPATSTTSTTSITSTTPTASFQTCNQASAGQFPFVVAVGDAVSGIHSCAGFIYNADYVVTTASCADKWVIN